MSRLSYVLMLLALGLAGTGFGPAAVLGPDGTQQPLFTWQVGKARDMAPPNVTAEGVVVMDVATGRVLYSRNAHQHYAPASLTKMVTALVAMDRAKLTDRVPINFSWQDVPPESSVMGLEAGEELTMEGLLCGLLLVSGNDAAVAIAKHIAGSEPAFVQLMNQKTRELGLQDTHFENPHGLDTDGHFSSPYDMAVIGRNVLSNPDLARIVALKQERVLGRGIYPMRNINRIVQSYPGGDGIKTGFTDLAKQAVVGSASVNGSRAIVVVMRSDGYAADASNLFDYTFNAFTGIKIEPPTYPPSLQDPIVDTLQLRGNSLADKMLVPRWERDYVRQQVWLDPSLGDGQGGPAGWISFLLDGNLLTQRPLFRK
ncbi:MAG: D-alanyl-D-alanine carboxypeptidase [Bacteroidetes bacterium]|nr:D-alanyl-D-alanine carboxypeptidase [Bacteroidota bacterium]MCL5027015.1 D-alanyl-D-alanine carboxypeptidase [Chloroflexota bacterium]